MVYPNNQAPSLIDVAEIKNKTILAFGAHPDDLEFAAAGTLMQLSRSASPLPIKGGLERVTLNKLQIVVATDGSYGTHDLDQDKGELTQIRYTEARIAAKKLGAQSITFWGYPDLDLQNRKKQLLKKVIKILLKVKPDIVFSFDPWGRYDAYVHPDHRALAWAVTEGVMISTLPKWNQKHGLGNRHLNPKPQLWLYAPAVANVAVDISSFWQRRLDVVKIFISQFDHDFQWQNTERWLESSYSQSGALVGVQYAESFRILEYHGEWDK
jgi:LmbE family N-acetylglucosaminyl deacetylase